MLRELEVRDLGIIEKVRLELPAGFIVLTGETGAGKSLLVQSLQLLAGERADADQVRGGRDRLIVEGCFLTPPDDVALELLGELGVEAGEELVLRREVSANGRSRAWANDVPVTVGALQRLAPFLLAIHGQHEQRGLTDPATHIALVDAAGGLGGAREGVAAAYALWQEAREKLDSQRRALVNRRDRLDVIAFQAREIEEARPEPGEEDTLREERAFLQHAERIGELVAAALAALAGEGGAVALARAARAMRELHTLGIGVGDTASDLEQAQVLAEEAERAVGELPTGSARTRRASSTSRTGLRCSNGLRSSTVVRWRRCSSTVHGCRPSGNSWKASRTTSYASKKSRSVWLHSISRWPSRFLANGCRPPSVSPGK